MNPTQIMAFNEITQWIKYKGFTQEDLAQILCAVDKECLKARGITISELISKKDAEQVEKDAEQVKNIKPTTKKQR